MTRTRTAALPAPAASPSPEAAERELRTVARDAIRAGRIPACRPARIWGGCGAGQPCDVCQAVVGPDDFEIEIEFPRNGASWRPYHLHVRCCSAWEAARKDFADGAALHPRGASPNGVTLPGAEGAGSIGGRERDPATGRGLA